MSGVFYNSDGRSGLANPLAKDHIGIVMQNFDPKGIERIKVYIPGLLNPNNEVWFMKEKPFFNGATYGVPKNGDKVRVWFKNNNIMEGYYGLDYSHSDDRYLEFNPGEHGFIDDHNNKLKFTDKGTELNTKNLNIKSSSITADVNTFTVSGTLTSGNGYTGSFATADGFTVTVIGGIITDIS